MRSRNNELVKKAMTVQVNQIKPDDSTSIIAETMDMDNDIDEFRNVGRHKVGNMKAHNQVVKASFTIHTPKGSQIGSNDGKSFSSLANVLVSNHLSESQKHLMSSNPFKHTYWVKNESKAKFDDSIDQPDDTFDDQTEFQVEEFNITITDSNDDNNKSKGNTIILLTLN
jgi:hypothetical protein